MATYCIAKDSPALYPECAECDDRLCEKFFCMIVGSRGFTDYGFLKSRMDYLLGNRTDVVIVSGGARGVDTLAERYAEEKGLRLIVFPADWDTYGKQAGYIRNEEMHRYIAKARRRGIAAFWDGTSKGTAQNFPLAAKYHNQLIITRV